MNGRATQAVLDISNNEPKPVTLMAVGGSLTTLLSTAGAPGTPVSVRNLTTARFGAQIPPGHNQTVTYSFTVDMHPQDLALDIAAILKNDGGTVFTKPLFNETVSIVEAPVSIFDPQMYDPCSFRCSCR